MTKKQNNELQRMARMYLARLKGIAKKHGLSEWIANIIKENKRGECSATETEVELLSRACDDERMNRHDVPRELGLSYRHCVESGLFDKLKKLKFTGIYSKVGVILFKNKIGDEKQDIQDCRNT